MKFCNKVTTDMPFLIKGSVCHSNGVGLVVRRYGYYANGFRFNFPIFVLFFFLTFFRLRYYV